MVIPERTEIRLLNDQLLKRLSQNNLRSDLNRIAEQPPVAMEVLARALPKCSVERDLGSE
jgi:hypothetical protein